MGIRTTRFLLRSSTHPTRIPNMPRKIASSPTASYHTVSDSEPSDFEPSPPPAKRARTVKSKIKTVIKTKIIESKGDLADIEDVGTFIHRSHGVEYHSISEVAKLQRELLNWFEGVRSGFNLDPAN